MMMYEYYYRVNIMYFLLSLFDFFSNYNDIRTIKSRRKKKSIYGQEYLAPARIVLLEYQPLIG